MFWFLVGWKIGVEEVLGVLGAAGLIRQHSSELLAPDWRVMTISFWGEGVTGSDSLVSCHLIPRPFCLAVIDGYIVSMQDVNVIITPLPY